MKKIIAITILLIGISSNTAQSETKAIIVRTNPSGHETTVTSKPLMTYQQAEKIIKQNEVIIRQNKKIIKLLEQIERNTRK